MCVSDSSPTHLRWYVKHSRQRDDASARAEPLLNPFASSYPRRCERDRHASSCAREHTWTNRGDVTTGRTRSGGYRAPFAARATREHASLQVTPHARAKVVLHIPASHDARASEWTRDVDQRSELDADAAPAASRASKVLAQRANAREAGVPPTSGRAKNSVPALVGRDRLQPRADSNCRYRLERAAS